MTVPAATAVRAMVPILRSFDEAATRDFYIRWLGFEVVFEHRFEPDTPLYMGVRLGGYELHLSEHYGDSTPGSAVRIEMDDVVPFHRGLVERGHRHARPGVQDQDWGWREVAVKDPGGNRLVFCSPLRDA